MVGLCSDLKREVPEEKILEYSKAKNLPFIETSSKVCQIFNLLFHF